MAKEEIQVKIDAAVNSAEAAKSLGQLRRSLIEIQTLQQELGETSGPQFDKLSQASAAASSKLAETRDRIGDIQDKTRTLEGTGVERLTGSFGLLRESVMNLDFDKAKIGAEGLLNAFTPVVDGKLITGFAGIKGAVGGLMDGVKSLGSTFLSVGKALLTNPIFLLATAITLIVIGIVKLMDSLGLLKPILDGIKVVIGFIVDGFKALTDWLGLTTNAQEEQAAAAKKAGEEQRKEIDATATEQKNYAKLTENMTAEEIAQFNKKAGIRDNYNRSSFDIEKQRLTATQETLKAEIDALNELEAAGGELTEEQQKDLEQRKADYEKNAAAIKQVEMEKQKAIIDINKDSSNTLRALQIRNITDANERSKAQLKITKDEEIRNIQVKIEKAKAEGADTTKLKQGIKEIETYYNNESLKIDKQVQEQKVAKAKESSDRKAKILDEEFKKLQTHNEALIVATKENSIERLKITIDGLNKEFEYETTKFKKTADEIKILKAELDNDIKQLQDDFDKSQFENMTKVKAAEKDFLKKEAAEGEFITTKQLEDKIAFNREAIVKELADLEKSAQDKEAFAIKSAEIIAKYDADAAAVKSLYRQKDNEELIAANQLNLLLLEQKKIAIEGDAELVKKTNEELLKDNLSYEDEKLRLTLKNLKDVRDIELQNVELTESQKKLIKEKYLADELEAIKASKEEIRALNFKELEQAGEYAQRGLDAVGQISDAAFAWKQRNLNKETAALMNGLKVGTKEYDKANAEKFRMEQALARKMFNTNKAMQLSGAVIDGFRAITSSLSQSPVAIGPIPNPAGIASLAFAAITTATNIAKIAASKFQEGTPPATTVPEPNLGGNGGDGAGAPSNFSPNQFFGLGQATAAGMPGGQKPIKVYVSEGDIRDVSERVSVIEERAVLGP
jgi:hypothetical protein